MDRGKRSGKPPQKVVMWPRRRRERVKKENVMERDEQNEKVYEALSRLTFNDNERRFLADLDQRVRDSDKRLRELEVEVTRHIHVKRGVHG